VSADGPHRNARVLTGGTPLDQARAAMVLLHGRGASADDILPLGLELAPESWCFLAPQASGGTWYPETFLAPRSRNEPWLSSALAAVDAVVAQVFAAGIGAERAVIAGFSQGACLTLDYAARHPRRYGAILAFTGGLIGAPGEALGGDPQGDLGGAPVFIGCSDGDPHVPVARVNESTALLRARGANVTEVVYPGLGHTINADELRRGRALVEEIEADLDRARAAP
jgi:predicted esterase